MERQNFHTMKLGEIAKFYAVKELERTSDFVFLLPFKDDYSGDLKNPSTYSKLILVTTITFTETSQ